jgi:transposase
VAYLGQLDEEVRLGVKEAAEGHPAAGQTALFDKTRPEWVEVDARRVRVERCRDFGGPWLALKLAGKVGLCDFLRRTLPSGREDIGWGQMALVLVIARLCNPSSELHIAEHLYRQSGLSDLLGIPAQKVNEQRLYRALDALVPQKDGLEQFLKERLGTLFGLDYDLLLYDVTSTYFEGEAKGNALAQYGYSRDRRSDCKQVCIGLVVSREGMPIGCEVFPGNSSDVSTVEEIVERMEARYGKAQRIWVLDRGMISQGNMEFLKEDGRRYIVGTRHGAC